MTNCKTDESEHKINDRWCIYLGWSFKKTNSKKTFQLQLVWPSRSWCKRDWMIYFYIFYVFDVICVAKYCTGTGTGTGVCTVRTGMENISLSFLLTTALTKSKTSGYLNTFFYFPRSYNSGRITNTIRKYR